MDLLKDEDIEEAEKKQLLACWFLDDPGSDFEECLQALTDFVINYKETKVSEEEDNNEEDMKHNQVISYNQDAPYIISGFLECYGIDLTEIPYMHWWKFQMLIDGMNEDCELKKRMGYRSIDLNQIKDKEERERIRKIQKQIAIIDYEVTSEEIGDAFEICVLRIMKIKEIPFERKWYSMPTLRCTLTDL